MKADKGTKKRGFMHWYESYQGKKVVGAVYSLGASVVIIGALFKIMHFPGAGVMLTVGMGIEALLFAIGVFDKPHTEFHWNNVFPQLLGHGTDPKVLEEMKDRPCPTLLGGVGGQAAAPAQAAPAVSSPIVDSAAVGVAAVNLAKTAEQFKDLGDVASVTKDLVSKLEAAGQTAEQFAQAGKVMTEKSAALGETYAQVNEDMQKVVAGAKECDTQVASASDYLQKMNAIYEMQLNALQAQVDAYKAQTEKVENVTTHVEALATNVQTLTEASAEAMKSHEAYAIGAQQLANQVADLNKVYGNMLNAL
jgi:gliding motility-associated protein GldL